MSVLSRLAHSKIGPPQRRDEIPNQELARDLATRKNRASREAGIREIAENLWNTDAAIQADCVKVLYEIGAIDPALIAEYVGDFLKLLPSKNNRLVWGGMTALAAIAELKAAEIYAQRDLVLHIIETGSVITKDNGLKTLAIVAATAPARRQTLFPILLRYLETCRPKDVPQYAEKIVVAVLTRSASTRFARDASRRMGDTPAPPLGPPSAKRTDRGKRRGHPVVSGANGTLSAASGGGAQGGVTAANRADFKRVLEKRMTDMSAAQVTRVKKILRDIEKR